uniref:Uncharacterized protein n=1 Tax=Steinernema glaseri TaxID=37863 RepID=A0A1I7ZUM3_9BILA
MSPFDTYMPRSAFLVNGLINNLTPLTPHKPRSPASSLTARCSPLHPKKALPICMFLAMWRRWVLQRPAELCTRNRRSTKQVESFSGCEHEPRSQIKIPAPHFKDFL